VTRNAIEHTGFWWDPAKPGERWAGTLRISSKGRSSLKLTTPPSRTLLPLADHEYDVLHGQTDAGALIPVLKCFERNHGDYFVNASVVGFHAISPNPLLTRCVGVVDDLEAWWDQRP
jgi:hypothetical protein